MTSCSKNCNTCFIWGRSSGFASVHRPAISMIASTDSTSASVHLLSTTSSSRFSFRRVFSWTNYNYIMLSSLRFFNNLKLDEFYKWSKDSIPSQQHLIPSWQKLDQWVFSQLRVLRGEHQSYTHLTSLWLFRSASILRNYTLNFRIMHFRLCTHCLV